MDNLGRQEHTFHRKNNLKNRNFKLLIYQPPHQSGELFFPSDVFYRICNK